MQIFNIKGQLIKTLTSEDQSAGRYTVVWAGMDDKNNQVSSGVYFYRLETANYTSTKKMMLIK